MFTRHLSPRNRPAHQVRWPGIATLTMALWATTAVAPAHAQTSTDPLVQDTAELAADLANRYVQSPLAFTPCAENPRLDCATLTVPADYAKP